MSAADARAAMLDAGLEPLDPYPGIMNPWRAVCLGCGQHVSPALHNIRSGQGGCTHCAVRGIDLAKPGYLYLIVHDDRQALKVGIANVEQRLKQHARDGWRLVGRWNADVVRNAREIERETLDWFTRQDIPYAFERGEMRYRGYTETARLADVSLGDVEAFVNNLAVGVLHPAAGT